MLEPISSLLLPGLREMAALVYTNPSFMSSARMRGAPQPSCVIVVWKIGVPRSPESE